MRAQSILYFPCTGAMMPTLGLLETSFIGCPSRHLDEDSYLLPRVCITPFEGGCCYHDRHSATYCQARPWTQTYPCCKPCRAHGLDTCSLGLGRVFNHRFSRREICPPKSHRDEESMQIHHCRLSTLRQVRSTCRRKLAGNRNHFSTMGPAVGCRS